jgi:hypothetical protein
MPSTDAIDNTIKTLSELYTFSKRDRQAMKRSLYGLCRDVARAQREADLGHPWVDEELAGSIRNTPLVVPSTED